MRRLPSQDADGKPRPVVVLPFSTAAELTNNPLAGPLVPSDHLC